MADKLLKPTEAGERLGVKRGTLEVWRSTRRYALPFVKIGGRVFYREADIERFIAASRVIVRPPKRPVRRELKRAA